MHDHVQQSWKQLDTWIAANAPKLAATLRAGTTPAAIAAANTTLGFDLPQELCDSLSCHDGQEDGLNEACFEGAGLLSLELIVFCVQQFADPENALIPFAGDGGGNYMCVERETGRVVDYDHEDPDERAELAETLGDLLDCFAESAVQGELDWNEDDGLVVEDDDE